MKYMSIVLLIFVFCISSCSGSDFCHTNTETSTLPEANVDTSYMWLDTTAGDYKIDTLGIHIDTSATYTYHTNGMSALLRIYTMQALYDGTPRSRIIYQDANGVPRAVMKTFGKWICADRVEMDRIIQNHAMDVNAHGRTYATYYQAIFEIGFARFRVATNPIACETASY